VKGTLYIDGKVALQDVEYTILSRGRGSLDATHMTASASIPGMTELPSIQLHGVDRSQLMNLAKSPLPKNPTFVFFLDDGSQLRCSFKLDFLKSRLILEGIGFLSSEK